MESARARESVSACVQVCVAIVLWFFVHLLLCASMWLCMCMRKCLCVCVCVHACVCARECLRLAHGLCVCARANRDT